MGACRPVGYVPRQTATSDLRRIVAAHLPAFVERIEHDGGTLPGFVTAELERLLRCGDFEHGFLRLRCTRCGDDLHVPFSCKARGICPSCIGRRMCETAANWLEHLLPEVPYRQWVLSFDSSLAVRLGDDARALGLLCRSFARRVTKKLRQLCKQQHGPCSVARLHPGLLVVVQRFRSDCGLYVHLHVLATDGVWQELPGDVVFRPVTDLREVDLVRVLDEVAADLTATGVLDDDELPVDVTLAACVQLSLSTPPAASVVAVEPDLVVYAHGMSLHAATTVDGRDRKRLERMCKYLLRPPFAHDAVHLLPDGRVRLDLPRKGRFIDMTPQQFLGKLAALVPPPHANLVRYAGVFANRHHLRPRVVPTPDVISRPPVQLQLFDFPPHHEREIPLHRDPEPRFVAEHSTSGRFGSYRDTSWPGVWRRHDRDGHRRAVLEQSFACAPAPHRCVFEQGAAVAIRRAYFDRAPEPSDLHRSAAVDLRTIAELPGIVVAPAPDRAVLRQRARV